MNARTLILAGAISALSAVPLSAAPVGQQPPGRPPAMPSGPGGGDAPLGAGQIQRWFEAFTVLQAQDALQLSEAQYGPFVTRLKALQDARRRHQIARNQIMGDLRRLTNPQNASTDEGALAERLKALRDEDERAAVDLKKGYEGVEETLDTRQQARFRIFEERVEQQKLELLMKTRQNARAARGRGKSQ